MISKRQHSAIIADFDRLAALGKADREAARVAIQNARRQGIDTREAETAVLLYAKFRGSSLAGRTDLL